MRRDPLGNGLRPDSIAPRLQPGRAGDIDGESAIHPTRQLFRVWRRHVVAARNDCDAGSGRRRPLEDDVGQRTARVNGDNDIGAVEGEVVKVAGDDLNASAKPGPRDRKRLVQFRPRWRQFPVHRDRKRGRIVEQEHDVRQQTVPAGQVHYPAAAKPATDAACDFPCFVELFTWQAPGMADSARDAVEESVSWKSAEIVVREPAA